jgi:hypothetical protein
MYTSTVFSDFTLPCYRLGQVHKYLQEIYMIDTLMVPKICRTKLEREQSKQDYVMVQYVKFGFLFFKKSRPALGPTPLSILWVPGHSPG